MAKLGIDVFLCIRRCLQESNWELEQETLIH